MELCGDKFPTRNGLVKHKVITHKNDEKDKKQTKISFSETEENVLMTEEHCQCHGNKVRFKEINDERAKNDEWRALVNEESETNEAEVLHNEVKETEANKSECEEAKEKELMNFQEYNVYDEVEDKGQQVLGTRFVLTKKEDGSIKARFVIKGFQEEIKLSDSPTASRDTVKVFFTITANQKWILEGSDVKSAFLQSDEINRDVYIEPPSNRVKKGIIWKLRKPSYGLKDASKQWFETVRKCLLNLGMKQSLRDCCLFYYHKNGQLSGLLVFHVDDFLSSGGDSFQEDIILPLRRKNSFGRIQKGKFTFTGLNIFKTTTLKYLLIRMTSFQKWIFLITTNKTMKIF